MNRRILHIDDDPALGRLVAKALERRGYAVENVATGAEGLSRLRQGGIDVVVLDHYLRGETGLGILQAMADEKLTAPVVYVTGSSETAIAVEALKSGAADYVHKSVDEDFFVLLASAIDQAVEQSRLREAKDAAEREVREARDRAELLLAEVNHRVANSLALVASLVRLQSSSVSDPTARDALSETEARITAIAGLHRRLYTSHDIRSVDLDEYLRTLALELDFSMASPGRRPSVQLDLAPFSITTDRAISVGVIVTELLTNAMKYAYPEDMIGEVRVILRTQSSDSAEIRVEDDGIGWNGKGAPKGTGLGSKIVNAMARNLGTTVVYDTLDTGTRARLSIENTKRAAESQA